MNILRWKRKSKNKIRPKTILLFIFSLIMTTFAWFAYSKVIEPTLNIHVAAWDIEYYIGDVKQTNEIGIEIPILYPAMPEEIITIDIKNNGETLVDIEYNVEKVTILGEEYSLIQEGQAIPTEPTAKYIILTPPTYTTKQIGVDEETGTILLQEIVEGTITNDITNLPFTIEIEHTAQIEPMYVDDYGVDVSGEGYLKATINWIGDTEEIDSLWGFAVSEYLEENPDVTSAMSVKLTIDAYQAEEQPHFEPDEVRDPITVIMPSTAETKPYLPTGFSRKPGTTLHNGLVIRDPLGNEYVWVEVPKINTVYVTTGLGKTNFTDDLYASIENDLKNYSSEYNTRNDQITRYQATGIPEVDYPGIKNQVLKSIYENGGFYIGRYETGIEGSYRRSTSGAPTETPVIKANAYPFNWLSCSQAQSLASGMESGEYTSGLMFGFQWDLTLKYLEEKSAITSEDGKVDSTKWGNYKNSIYDITNAKAKYVKGTISTSEWIKSPYNKEKEDETILYTTGGSGSRMRQNIYDLAGNLAEWTLNLTTISGKTVGGNGGDYAQDGKITTTTHRSETYNAELRYENVGFRVTIY